LFAINHVEAAFIQNEPLRSQKGRIINEAYSANQQQGLLIVSTKNAMPFLVMILGNFKKDTLRQSSRSGSLFANPNHHISWY
jgi:hypothetical protein